jgi:hypothetical protein
MPYIITTTTPRYSSLMNPRTYSSSVPRVSRVAIATLEEMHQKAFAAIDRASKMDRDMNSDEQRADRGWRLQVRFDLEDGGQVGPLPDGTVIEVQAVCWNWIIGMADDRGIDTDAVHEDGGDLAILAAFNGAT